MANGPIGNPITTKIGLELEVTRDAAIIGGPVTLIVRGHRVGTGDGTARRLDITIELGPLEASEAEALGDLLLRAAGWSAVNAGAGLEAALVKASARFTQPRPLSVGYVVDPPALPPALTEAEIDAVCAAGPGCPEDCLRCSGEFCDTHGLSPCDCDTADRHLSPKDRRRG